MSNRALFATLVAGCIVLGAILGATVAAALPSTWRQPGNQEGIH